VQRACKKRALSAKKTQKMAKITFAVFFVWLTFRPFLWLFAVVGGILPNYLRYRLLLDFWRLKGYFGNLKGRCSALYSSILARLICPKPAKSSVILPVFLPNDSLANNLRMI